MPPHTYHPLCKATSSTISRILIFPVTSTRSKILSHSFLFYEIARSLKIIEAYKNIQIFQIFQIFALQISNANRIIFWNDQRLTTTIIFFSKILLKRAFFIFDDWSMIRENVNERSDTEIDELAAFTGVARIKVREQGNVETKEQSGTNYNMVKYFCSNSGRKGNGRMIRVGE